MVIELKKNQTSDHTVGQVAHYISWIKKSKGDETFKGIIIVGDYDKKLEYAPKVVTNVDVFLYKIDFKFTELRGI